MPVPTRHERRRANLQLTLFETRIALPRWRDLEPPIRMEIVATLAAVLAGQVAQDRAIGEGADSDE